MNIGAITLHVSLDAIERYPALRTAHEVFVDELKIAQRAEAERLLEEQAIVVPLPGVDVAELPGVVTATFSTDDLLAVAARVFDVSPEAILSRTRARHVTRARQAVMWVMRHGTDMSLQAIGGRIGGRDHTTVINSCQKVDTLLAGRPESIESRGLRAICEHFGIGHVLP